MSGLEPTFPDSTCWTVIRRAASGARGDRSEFARRYGGLVRAYLLARWGSPLRRADVDDAVQEVFVECFREGGVLARSAETPPESFRAFLKGVVRNVALRFETDRREREQQPGSSFDLGAAAAAGDSPSRSFDRAWAHMLLDEAVRLQEEAASPGSRRGELLRLRFQEGMPIRAIAERWGESAEWVHHEYARARRDFRTALLTVLRRHLPSADAEQESRALAELLGPPET